MPFSGRWMSQMQYTPKIKSDKPRANFNFGSHTATLYGDIVSVGRVQYTWLLVVFDALKHPALIVSAEVNSMAAMGGGSHFLCVFEESGRGIVSGSDDWADEELFTARALGVVHEKLPSLGKRAHRTVLFLCTGNYYRSRFAEHLFNHLAEERGLAWRAVSRGLSNETGPWKTGPISQYARAGLESRGIKAAEPHREPMYCEEADLSAADVIVALKEAEHRALVAARFPAWAGRVEYWHVHDIDVAHPDQALPALEALVRSLLDRLADPAGMVR